MKVTVSPVKGLSQEVTISVPNKEIQPEVEKKLQTFAAQARLPGFRPGKVPLKVVQQRFGAAARREVVGEVMNKTYFEAIQQEKLKPASMPEIEIVKDKAGEDLEYKAKFEVMPEIEVKDLDKIKVEKIVAEVVDADLDEMLETLRKQHVDWHDVKRAAKKGDKVTLDFDGYIDDKPFEGGKADNFDVILGSNSMIPDFEKGLEGLKAGDEKELKVKFPKDYHVKDLAEKPAVFKVNIKKVCEPKELPLDAKFAKKFNVDSVAELKKEIRNNMERELEFSLKNSVKDQVIEGLLKHNDVKVPQAMLTAEVDNLRQQTLQRMGIGAQQKNKAPALPDALFTEQAQRRVSLGLLMAKIIEDHNIKADPERVKAMVTKLAGVYENPEEMVKQYQADRRQMAEIEQVVIEEQVVDKILESATVKEKKMSFSEVMKPKSA